MGEGIWCVYRSAFELLKKAKNAIYLHFFSFFPENLLLNSLFASKKFENFTTKLKVQFGLS